MSPPLACGDARRVQGAPGDRQSRPALRVCSRPIPTGSVKEPASVAGRSAMAWRDLVSEAELEENVPRLVEVDGHALCVVRACGGIHVIDDTCTHEDYSLSEGEVYPEFCEIECPKHAS